MSSKENQIEAASDEYNGLQRDLSSYISARQQLEAQRQENKIVKEEFDLLADDAKVYKMIGPALVPQDKAESLHTVEKRLEFIENEIKRVESQVSQTQKKMDEKRDSMLALRSSLK